jgi:hypothetical protein
MTSAAGPVRASGRSPPGAGETLRDRARPRDVGRHENYGWSPRPDSQRRVPSCSRSAYERSVPDQRDRTRDPAEPHPTSSITGVLTSGKTTSSRSIRCHRLPDSGACGSCERSARVARDPFFCSAPSPRTGVDVDYAQPVSFRREIAARTRRPRYGLFSLLLPLCGRCPGDSVRPCAICPLRRPLTPLEFDTATCPE